MFLASALAPAIGGILATIFSIKLVYGIAAGIFIVAAAPMFFGKRGFQPRDFKLERLRRANIKSDLSAYGGWAIVETTEEVVWPIIIFLIVSSYASIDLLMLEQSAGYDYKLHQDPENARAADQAFAHAINSHFGIPDITGGLQSAEADAS